MNNNPSTQETKGEVLGKGKIIDTNIGAVEMYLKDHVLVSMDEYAKQKAIAFETWRRIQEREGNLKIYRKTPGQLYDLFLSSNHTIQDK